MYIYTAGPEYVNNVNNVNNDGRGAEHVPPSHRHKALIYAESGQSGHIQIIRRWLLELSMGLREIVQ